MLGIGTQKRSVKTKATIEPKHEILRIRGLKMDASPRRLRKLLRQHDMEPVAILIKADDRRRAVAFITLRKDEVLNGLRLLSMNIDAWMLNEDERRELRWPQSEGWQP